MNDTHPFSDHSDERSLGTRPSALTDFCLILLLATVLTACGPLGPVQAAADGQGLTTGAALFDSLECNSCHRMNGRGSGPSLVGIYAQKIPLDNGVAVTVDDQYIRNAILNPEAQIHAGYQPVMPSFEGQIGEEELSKLVNYVRSLTGGK